MKNEIVFVLEPDSGRATVEFSMATPNILRELRKELGEPITVNCARPATSVSQPEPIPSDFGQKRSVRFGSTIFIDLFRLYHYSTVDGPGRRSVVQVAGCSIRCPGFTYSLERGTYDFAHERRQQQMAHSTEKLLSSRKEEVYIELTTAIDGMDRNIAYLNENKSSG